MLRRAPGAIAALALGATTLALGVGPAAASPLDLFGFGGRSPGLAGAGVASTRDYEAVYLNPAGLADVTRKRAVLGGLYGDFSLQLDGVDTGTEPARGLVFGGQVPMPLGGALRDRVGLGFGFFVPTAAINRVRAPRPGTPTFALLESRSQVVGLQLALGVRLAPRWSVGLGLNALAVLRGGIAVTTDGSGRFTTQSEQRLLTRFAPIAGVRWRWRGDVDLGAVARAPSRSDYDIVVTNDLGDVLPLTLPAIRIAGNSQYDPWTVAAEAAWRVSDTVTVTGHLAWQHWSGFPLPTENPVAATPPQQPPGFHDTAVPRLAVERVAPALGGELALRAGYAFLWSPAPEMTGRQSLLDNHRHLFAAGVGLAWPRGALPVHLDAWVQLHQLQPRRHEKDVGLFPPGEAVPFDVLATRGRMVVGGLTVGIDL
jgi:long-subunit fatty acid transport protein